MIDANSCYLIMGASASINYAEHKLCNQKFEKGFVVTHDNMSHRTRKTRCVSSHLIYVDQMILTALTGISSVASTKKPTHFALKQVAYCSPI